MPTRADVYRVFVASPSDLAEERQAATEVVYEWNAQHAMAESVVLLPLKWETHAIPQSGVRPQEAINRQLVRGSDILIGMFWTKFGTSTGVAESGTVEEIDQFVAAKKPAMLYFSSRPVDPNKIDLKQHRKLRRFKAATYKKALVGAFSTVAELRQTLLRDLVRCVRQLKTSGPSRTHRKDGGNQKSDVREIPSREDYVRETIEQAHRSGTSISMCVHTLSPAVGNNDVSRLQDTLSAKVRAFRGVRLIAPAGEERVAASFQLASRRIPVRHLADLQNLDMSFSVFDSERAVIRTKSGPSKKTVAGVTLESTKLAEMLELLFDDLWTRFDVLPHSDFVRFTARQILQASPDMSLVSLGRRLKVEPIALRKLLPVFDAHLRPCDFLFIIGRPCSGKTTIATALRSALAQRGIRPEQVYYFNDYEVLYERFQEDRGQKIFRSAKHGGFEVHDFSVLDSVLQQANFRLHMASRFFRICIVEFARNAYMRPLLNFERAILEKCTVVHVKCSLDTCRKRNNKRRGPSRDHRSGYVPDKILDSFYAKEDLEGLTSLPLNGIVSLDTGKVSLHRLQDAVTKKILPLVIGINRP